MPAFGEYETLDQPLSQSERPGQARTHWIAKRPGLEDGRVYFIKALALPGPGSTQELDAQGRKRADLTADFFESIARLKEAYRAYPERITPIRAFGQTDTELWYAADYYPRQSLAEFYSTAADINDESLRHVVYSVASACLALQRSTGLSHGNLKTNNILLKGARGPLRLTQLRLVDAASSTAFRRSLEASQGSLGGNLRAALRDATEAHDLRGIGAMILELVESNHIEGPEDYTLPIELSMPWRALGEESPRWLEFCNQLLDPGLPLDKINLQSLADDYAPRPKQNQSKAFLAVLGVLVAGGIASYPLWFRSVTQGRTKTWTRSLQRMPPVTRPNPSALGQSTTTRFDETLGKTNLDVARLPLPAPAVAPASPTFTAPTATIDSPTADSTRSAPALEASAPSSTGHSGGARTPELGPNRPEPEPRAPALVPQSNPAASIRRPPTFKGAVDTSGNTEPAPVQVQANSKPINDAPPLLNPNRGWIDAQPRDIRSQGQSVVSRPRPIDIAKLDEQLRQLEAEVTRVVAVRRNSGLFSNVDLLEAQYAKANQLSGRIKKRLDLLRATMVKKIPGTATRNNMNGVAPE